MCSVAYVTDRILDGENVIVSRDNVSLDRIKQYNLTILYNPEKGNSVVCLRQIIKSKKKRKRKKERKKREEVSKHYTVSLT